jgi:ketosteroid isomerase-like protein
MAHPNQDLVQRGYEAFASGDIPTVLTLFADDIKWHIPGRSALAGDYEGKEAVMSFFAKLQEQSGGTFRMELHDILGGDDHVVALVRSTATRGGQSRTSDIVHVWHVGDGRATEFWGVPSDAYADDEFWGS